MNEKDPTDTPPMPRPRGTYALRGVSGKAWPWVLVLLLCIAGGIGLWQWQSREPAKTAGLAPASTPSAPSGRRFGGANAVQPVSVESVRRQDIRVTVNAIGSMVASNTATVHAQVSGVLQSLSFKEGQQVEAGQLLAQIDPRAFQAALGQAEGALARDKAQLEGARVDLARYRELLAKDAIPKQQLDTQVALVGQLEGTVKADQGTVDSARLQLSYTRVTAPIAGRAGLKQVDLGNVVQPADTNGIVSITQTRPIALIFAVPAANLPLISARLRKGENVPVHAFDRGSTTKLAVGQVATLDNAIDPTTDTIKVKALFANADDALFPNQAVSVTLQIDILTDVLAVPQAAVLRGSQGFYVYVVNADSTVSTRVVKPGAVDANWMAVEGPLQPDDKVVIDGVDRLRDGAKVEVIAADPKQRAGANAPVGGARSGTRRANGSPSTVGGAATGSNSSASAGASDRSASALSAGSAASDGERPRWMDRVSPEQAEKLKSMSPDERRAWFREQRELREHQPTR